MENGTEMKFPLGENQVWMKFNEVPTKKEIELLIKFLSLVEGIDDAVRTVTT